MNKALLAVLILALALTPSYKEAHEVWTQEQEGRGFLVLWYLMMFILAFTIGHKL